VIKVGDTIRHKSVPAGVMDVEVLGIVPCDPGGGSFTHDAYEINDPETGESDIVCSLDFVKVR
jgi:hypothetical protein